MSSQSATPSPGPTPLEVIRAMTGLEFLTGIAEARLPPPPMAATLGFGLVSVEKGRVVFEGTPTFAHLNPFATVHRGWAATVLDSCMGCAVQSTLDRGFGYTTLEFKVSFTRALTEATGLVRAEGRVISGGKRTAFAEGMLRDGSGRTLAHATATCLVFEL